MYQPTLGRFLSQDPLGPNGVDLLFDNNEFGAALDRMRNLYGYCDNRPTFYVDPSGLVPFAAAKTCDVNCNGTLVGQIKVSTPFPQTQRRPVKTPEEAFGIGISIGFYPNRNEPACCCNSWRFIQIVVQNYKTRREPNSPFVDRYDQQGNPLPTPWYPAVTPNTYPQGVRQPNAGAAVYDRPGLQNAMTAQSRGAPAFDWFGITCAVCIRDEDADILSNCALWGFRAQIPTGDTDFSNFAGGISIKPISCVSLNDSRWRAKIEAAIKQERDLHLQDSGRDSITIKVYGTPQSAAE